MIENFTSQAQRSEERERERERKRHKQLRRNIAHFSVILNCGDKEQVIKFKREGEQTYRKSELLKSRFNEAHVPSKDNIKVAPHGNVSSDLESK